MDSRFKLIALIEKNVVPFHNSINQFFGKPHLYPENPPKRAQDFLLEFPWHTIALFIYSTYTKTSFSQLSINEAGSAMIPYPAWSCNRIYQRLEDYYQTIGRGKMKFIKKRSCLFFVFLILLSLVEPTAEAPWTKGKSTWLIIEKFIP